MPKEKAIEDVAVKEGKLRGAYVEHHSMEKKFKVCIESKKVHVD